MGFVLLVKTAEVVYKCTSLYEPSQEGSLLWNDPDIGIEWPLDKPLLSEKDEKGTRLQNMPELSV